MVSTAAGVVEVAVEIELTVAEEADADTKVGVKL
jgi:hypothetical protein